MSGCSGVDQGEWRSWLVTFCFPIIPVVLESAGHLREVDCAPLNPSPRSAPIALLQLFASHPPPPPPSSPMDLKMGKLAEVSPPSCIGWVPGPLLCYESFFRVLRLSTFTKFKHLLFAPLTWIQSVEHLREAIYNKVSIERAPWMVKTACFFSLWEYRCAAHATRRT